LNVVAIVAALASGKPDTFHGGKMYVSPKLERYGTFRDLTLGGGTVAVDIFGPNANGIGCITGVGGAFCAST
jgi:hypothetical protein